MAARHDLWARRAIKGKEAVQGHIHFDSGRLKPQKKLAAGGKPRGHSKNRSAQKGK